MRSSRNLPVYLVYIVGCVAVLGYIISQMGVVTPWAHPFRLSASVHDADGIKTGNEVYLNGTVVGHVDEVTAQGSTAAVSMVIDKAGSLPIDSEAAAAIRKKNLLGETYIEIVRGHGATAMHTGDAIPVARTSSPVEIDQVLAIFDPTTRDRLKLLINALGDATANRGDDLNSQAGTLRQLTTSLNGPAAELATRRQQLDDIVVELQRFYTVLAKQREQVRQEFGTWNAVMGQLAAQEGAIGGTLQQADQLLRELDGVVTGEVPQLQATLQALPLALQSTKGFLDQTNTTLTALEPVRRSIHDIFPHLGSSFADTNVQGQHYWSVFSVNCPSDCSSQTVSESGAAPAPDAYAALGGS
ncbi:MAG: MlaD family protein [Candidatus Dormibacteria bacterium]